MDPLVAIWSQRYRCLLCLSVKMHTRWAMQRVNGPANTCCAWYIETTVCR